MSSSGFKVQVLRAPRKNADGASAKKKSTAKKKSALKKRKDLEMKKRHKKGLNKLKH